MPELAADILRLSRDQDASLDELSAALARDPALSAKLLRAANSSLYGVSVVVSTVRRATVLLGLHTVKLLSLGFLLAGSIGRAEFGLLDPARYWRRSLTRAVAARTVAAEFRLAVPDDVYVSALLARIGQVVLAGAVNERYEEVVQRTEGDWPSPDTERAVLGFSGSDVGLALLDAWGLPKELTQGVRLLDGAEDAGVSDECGQTTALRLAAAIEEVLCGPRPAQVKLELDHMAARLLGLDALHVDGLLYRVEKAVQETVEFFEVAASPPVDVEELLAKVSVELERSGMEFDAQLTGQTERPTEDVPNEPEQVPVDEESGTDPHLDSLTGLPNRAHFEELLQSFVAEQAGARIPRGLGVLMIDIDGFAQLNATHGTEAGDEVLRAITGTIVRVTRRVDLPARYGGDELVVLIPGATPLVLGKVAERICGTLAAEEIAFLGDTLQVTVSVGGSFARDVRDMQLADKLVQAAEVMLHRAKAAGGNTWKLT
jgi:diguanylate cyclase (GGDEF)-like protein